MALCQLDCGLRVDQIESGLCGLQCLNSDEIVALLAEIRTVAVHSQRVLVLTLVFELLESQLVSGETLSVY